MKRHRISCITALATAALVFTMTPAHADETERAPTAQGIVKPHLHEKITPPRPPHITPCPIRPAPPGWQIPMYCDILPGPGIPIKPPPRDGIFPIIPSPVD